MLEQRVSSSMFHHPPETSQNLPLVSGVGAKSFLECGPSFSRSFSKSTSGCRFWIKKFPWEWSIILQKISQNLPLVYDDGAKSFISQNLSLVYDFGAKSFICQNLPLVSDVGAKSFIYQNLPFVSDVGAKSFIYQNLPFVSDIGAKSFISQNPPLVSEMLEQRVHVSKSTSCFRCWSKEFPWIWSIILQKHLKWGLFGLLHIVCLLSPYF
jgi:hypothetical protein